MPLAPVAHEAGPPDRERLTRRAGRHDVAGLPLHVAEQRVDALDVEAVEQGVVTAHDLVGHRGVEEPYGGADPRVRRDDDARDAGLLGDPGGVQGAVAAESDHGALGEILAAFDGMNPRGVRHVLIDDLRDAVGAGRDGERQWLGHILCDGAARALQIERQSALGEGLRVEIADDRIGIRHRRPGSAALVAGRPGFGRGTLRADGDPAEGIDRGDRAAAGADFDHLGHRNAHRQAAPLDEARGARDLEMARGLGRPVVDQTDLCRRAAHVERHHPVEAAGPGDRRGQNRAAAGPGFDQPDRKAHRRVEGRHAAPRGHDEKRAGQSVGPQPRLEVS